MLSNFFQLDQPFREFNETELVNFLKMSSDVRSVLYKPDAWPVSALRRLK